MRILFLSFKIFLMKLGLDKYVDYDLQFEKSFLEPLKIILDSIGWNVEKTVNLELFFSNGITINDKDFATIKCSFSWWGRKTLSSSQRS